LREVDLIGCDIGGTSIQLVRMRRLRILETLEIPSRRDSSPGQFVDDLLGPIRAWMASETPPAALGVAVPGFLDEKRRRIVRLSNLPRLDGLDLAARLERRVPALRGHVILDADSNAGAVGEARAGAGHGSERVLYVTLGTGLGAALVVRGEPVRASRHTAGQVAQLPVASGRAEKQLCARGVLARHRAICRETTGTAPRIRDTRALYERAASGDELALRAWHETGAEIASLLAILVPLWSPDVVVIGGGLAGASSLFLPETLRDLRRRLPRSHRDISIRVTKNGRSAGALGAALLAGDGLSQD